MSRAAQDVARFNSSQVSLELLERSGAEVRVEPLAIDRDGLKFVEVRSGRYVVVLVSFVTFQRTQLKLVGAVLEKVRVVIRVLCRDQNDVHVRSVECLEVRQAKYQASVSFLVNRGASRCLVDLSMKRAGFHSLRLLLRARVLEPHEG